MAMKYLVLLADDGHHDVVVFPSGITHEAMAEVVRRTRNQTYGNWRRVERKPVSAGFVNAQWACSGASEALGLEAKGPDAALMQWLKFLTMRDEDGQDGIFLFSNRIHHDAMAESLEGIEEGNGNDACPMFRRPVAGGFVEGGLTCSGRSEKLSKGSRPEDSVLLRQQMA